MQSMQSTATNEDKIARDTGKGMATNQEGVSGSDSLCKKVQTLSSETLLP